MAELGFKTINEMVGQSQKLNRNKAIDHYKSSGIDLTPILHKIDVPAGTKLYNTVQQDHKLETHLDFKIIKQAKSKGDIPATNICNDFRVLIIKFILID